MFIFLQLKRISPLLCSQSPTPIRLAKKAMEINRLIIYRRLFMSYFSLLQFCHNIKNNDEVTKVMNSPVQQIAVFLFICFIYSFQKLFLYHRYGKKHHLNFWRN